MSSEELELLGETVHSAPLNDDAVPNENQAHYCFSCEAPNTGLYCANCGQKNDDFRRSIFSLIKEVFLSITALEGRIWRTWAALLMTPGRVAREFSNGRRTYWSSPVRMYLAMSIFLFGIINLFNIQLISLDLNAAPKPGIIKEASNYTASDLDLDVEVHFFETKRKIDARNEARNFDLLDIKLSEPNKNFTGNFEITTSKITLIETDSQTPAETNEQSDDLISKIITSDQNSVIIQRFLQNPEIINAGFSIWLPRIMFFMMPFSMLIGIFFIRGRGNALMYDHLVHAAYIHAVAFLLILIGICASQITQGSNVMKVMFIAALIYLPISLKGMFKRGWVKTLWTSYSVGFIYLMVIIIFLTWIIFTQIENEVNALGLLNVAP